MNVWGTLNGVHPLPHQVRQSPVLNQRMVLSFPGKGSQRIDLGGQRFSSIIVQVMTGALDVCLADSTDTMADFRFVSAMGPQQIFLPEYDYTLSVSNPLSSATQAVLRVLG